MPTIPLWIPALAVTVVAATLPPNSGMTLPKAQRYRDLTHGMHPDPTSSQPNVVGWQSIFWGLFALALNAMTQPSYLDVSFPQSSLLFPARSSPFVCVADTLVVFCELARLLLSGVVIREAALEVNWRRVPDRRDSRDNILKETTIEKHPKASVVLFLGTLCQAVKIFSFQGVFWAKAAAAIYVSSYIVLAGVSLASRDLRNKYVPTHRKHNPFAQIVTVFGIIAVGIHGLVCCWAMFQVIHMEAVLSTGPSDIHGLTAVLYYVMTVLLHAVFLCLIMILLLVSIMMVLSGGILLPFASLETDTTVRQIRFVGIFLQMAFGGCFLYVTYGWVVDPEHLVLYRFSNVLAQGGGLLAIGIGCLVLCMKVVAWICGRVSFLQGWKLRTDLVTFALANLVVACLYCSFAYDPEGTIKPAWTEKLG